MEEGGARPEGPLFSSRVSGGDEVMASEIVGPPGGCRP